MDALKYYWLIAVIQEYRFLDLMKVSIWNNTQRKNQEWSCDGRGLDCLWSESIYIHSTAHNSASRLPVITDIIARKPRYYCVRSIRNGITLKIIFGDSANSARNTASRPNPAHWLGRKIFACKGVARTPTWRNSNMPTMQGKLITMTWRQGRVSFL